MSEKKTPILSIILYILAGLLGLYTIWAASFHYDNISTLIEQGQIVVSENQFELANYFLSNVGQHAIFGVILLTLGRILHVKSPDIDEYYLEEYSDAEGDEEGFEDLDQDPHK